MKRALWPLALCTSLLVLGFLCGYELRSRDVRDCAASLNRCAETVCWYEPGCPEKMCRGGQVEFCPADRGPQATVPL